MASAAQLESVPTLHVPVPRQPCPTDVNWRASRPQRLWSHQPRPPALPSCPQHPESGGTHMQVGGHRPPSAETRLLKPGGEQLCPAQPGQLTQARMPRAQLPAGRLSTGCEHLLGEAARLLNPGQDSSSTDALASGEEFHKDNLKYFTPPNIDISGTRVKLERTDEITSSEII